MPRPAKPSPALTFAFLDPSAAIEVVSLRTDEESDWQFNCYSDLLDKKLHPEGFVRFSLSPERPRAHGKRPSAIGAKHFRSMHDYLSCQSAIHKAIDGYFDEVSPALDKIRKKLCRQVARVEIFNASFERKPSCFRVWMKQRWDEEHQVLFVFENGKHVDTGAE